MPSQVIMGWILDYLGDVFWEEFKEQSTLDYDAKRKLFQGILCQKMKLGVDRIRLRNFLVLLVHLVDGRDVKAIHKDNQHDTPLEEALGCFELVMSDLECDCTENEVEQFRDIMKEQAVIVCCRSKDFDKAHLVFLNLFGETVQEDPSKPDSRTRVKVQRQLQSFINDKKVSQRFLDLHSYENFLQEAKTFLQKIYSTFEPPMLLSAQRKADQQKPGIIDAIDDDISLSSKAGTSTRRFSQQKGLGKPPRSLLDRHHRGDDTSNENRLPTFETKDNSGTSKELRGISPRKRKCTDTNTEKGVYTLAELKAATPSLTEKDWMDIKTTSNPLQSDSKEESTPTVSTQRRGNSIQDKKYIPNRNQVLYSRSSPEKAEDTKDDLMSFGSGSDTSLHSDMTSPTRKSPKKHHSHHNHGFMQLSNKKQFWTPEECDLLKKAVAHFGPGKWSQMRMAYDFNGRTNVNLKDKWRNMLPYYTRG
ncbi:telomeric repeat-binding factor 2-like isoform X1 [Asterias rubens]|uniref:telomeric repeat-binding factor 2-like isoform X1 n=1 Tax=Asterias rubens TaxID=7604 RepID=UPI001455A05F|nr:telomeric repeat-binding factor 2-like isoform X1 [Asterias rubens]